MNRVHRLLLVPLLAVALIAAACGDDDTDVAVGDDTTPTAEPTSTGEPAVTPDPTPTPDPTQAPTPEVDEQALADLTAARALWAENGLVTYSYTWSRFCECFDAYRGPFTVAVTDGVVTSMKSFGDPAPQDLPRRTVEDMFDEIADAIGSGVKVDVTYDGTDGHPLRVDLDLDALAVDGGTSYSVDGFARLGDVIDELAAARARWDAAGVDSYDLVYREVCFCPEIVVAVSVRDGVVVDSSVESEIDSGYEPPARTVEDLFAEIEAALALPPAHVTAQFDEETGYPVSYFVDEEEFIADEEFGISVEGLTPVA
jgi:hypothetical protein